jgi:hypothetical protein
MKAQSDLEKPRATDREQDQNCDATPIALFDRPDYDRSFAPMLDIRGKKYYLRTALDKDADFEVFELIVRAVNNHQALVEAAKQAINDINTARRHVYTGNSANPDDMTFDAIENTLEPSARILHAAIQNATQ